MKRFLLGFAFALLATGCPDEEVTVDPDLGIHDLKTCVVDMYLRPVCGADGKTYSNPEYASCANTTVAYDGPCHD